MPDESPTPTMAPPPPSAPVSAPHPIAPPAPSHLVQAIDRLGEIAAVLVAGYLCRAERLTGVEFMLFSGAVLGVQNTIRGVAASRGVAVGGVVSALLLAVTHGHVGAGTMAAGAAGVEVARRTGHAGFASLRSLLVLAGCVGVLAAAVALEGCPDLPPPSGCAPNATRCAPSGAPEVCSPTQRWTPSEERPCAAVGGVCCWTRSPYGRALHACARPANCLPETPADAGAEDAR